MLAPNLTQAVGAVPANTPASTSLGSSSEDATLLNALLVSPATQEETSFADALAGLVAETSVEDVETATAAANIVAPATSAMTNPGIAASSLANPAPDTVPAANETTGIPNSTAPVLNPTTGAPQELTPPSQTLATEGPSNPTLAGDGPSKDVDVALNLETDSAVARSGTHAPVAPTNSPAAANEPAFEAPNPEAVPDESVTDVLDEQSAAAKRRVLDGNSQPTVTEPQVPVANRNSSTDSSPAPEVAPASEFLPASDLAAGSLPTLANPLVQTAGSTAQASEIGSSTPVPNETASVGQVSDHIVKAHQSMEAGLARLEITLDPPELGRITIELRETDDQLAGKLIVSDPVTLESIKQSVPSMMDSLLDAGLDFENLELEHFEQNDAEQSPNETDNVDETLLEHGGTQTPNRAHGDHSGGVNILV